MESLTQAPASGRVAAVAAGTAVAVALAVSVAAAAFDPAGSAVFAETLSFGIAVSAVAVIGAVITLAVPGKPRRLAAAGQRGDHGDRQRLHRGGHTRRGHLSGLGPRRRLPGRPGAGSAGGGDADGGGGSARRLPRRCW
jgi:hypothetical protein